jgi:hypothetical protein
MLMGLRNAAAGFEKSGLYRCAPRVKQWFTPMAREHHCSVIMNKAFPHNPFMIH